MAPFVSSSRFGAVAGCFVVSVAEPDKHSYPLGLLFVSSSPKLPVRRLPTRTAHHTHRGAPRIPRPASRISPAILRRRSVYQSLALAPRSLANPSSRSSWTFCHQRDSILPVKRKRRKKSNEQRCTQPKRPLSGPSSSPSSLSTLCPHHRCLRFQLPVVLRRS